MKKMLNFFNLKKKCTLKLQRNAIFFLLIDLAVIQKFWTTLLAKV